MQSDQLKRREFITLLGGATAWPLAARSQQSEVVHRIGFLANDPTIPTQTAGKAFVEGLADHGFVEGRNIVIERRFAEGISEQSPGLAAQLIQLDVGLVVASGQNNIAPLINLTKSTPVVMINAASLASPGSNFTGLTSPVTVIRMLAKRLQLLKDAFPRITRLAVLRTPNFPTDSVQWDLMERRAAPAFNVKLVAVSINGRSDLEAAFAAIHRDHPDGLFCLNNPLTLILRKEIVQFAAGERIPAIYPFKEVAEAGGLMSYGANRPALFRRAAAFVAKILNGAKPADLPIEQPSKFELVLNLTTAKATGITIPPAFRSLADEVLE
jgi:putative ABC transport system substrate-binding protein